MNKKLTQFILKILLLVYGAVIPVSVYALIFLKPTQQQNIPALLFQAHYFLTPVVFLSAFVFLLTRILNLKPKKWQRNILFAGTSITYMSCLTWLFLVKYTFIEWLDPISYLFDYSVSHLDTLGTIFVGIPMFYSPFIVAVLYTLESYRVTKLLHEKQQ